MSRTVISVENLCKAYRIGLKEEIPDTLAEAAMGWISAPLRKWRQLRRLNTFEKEARGDVSVVSGRGEEVRDQRSEARDQKLESNGQALNGHHSPLTTHHPSAEDDTIWALRDVSFDVQEGEVVGIIGRNGAGKSTLLKILSRITEPTSGRVVIRGRVSSLLEVGTGFHPELTGRENVYMNGTILGMRKREIDRKFDEIVDFSGVQRFLDTPIKRYSSGMKVRLAFSVAAHLEPEILIIDEVLAVGDAEFQKKCLGKMQDVASGGRTVLFVSHNMAAVERLCMRALLVKSGAIDLAGDVTDVIKGYLTENQVAVPYRNCNIQTIERKAGDAYITRAWMTDDDDTLCRDFPMGSSLKLCIAFEAPSDTSVTIGLGLFDAFGRRLCGIHSDISDGVTFHGPRNGESVARCSIRALPLAQGTYSLNVVLLSPHGGILDRVDNCLTFQIHEADVFGTGRPPQGNAVIFLDSKWCEYTADPPEMATDLPVEVCR